MSNIKITKAEIKNRIFLKYWFIKSFGFKTNKNNTDSDAPIHPDLQQAFNNLIPHLALITEQVKKPDVVNVIDLKEDTPEELEKRFSIKSFEVSGSIDDESIKISGHRILKNGKRVAIETPITKRPTKDGDGYEFFDELVEKIEILKEEVFQYMEGKQAESNQTNMFDQDEAEDFVPEDDGPGADEPKLEEEAA